MIKKIFENNGYNFSAYDIAVEYLKKNGYLHGSMCGNMPIAIMKGNPNIAKWENIDPSAYNRMHGIMISRFFRNQNVIVIIFENGEGYNPNINYFKIK